MCIRDRVASGAIDPNYVEEHVQIDAGGLLAGDQGARQTARAELRRVLAPYGDPCQAGVVLTFGHAPNAELGSAIAARVNELLAEEFPDLFAGAAFEDFVNIGPSVGQVDIRIYFFTGCAPAESKATPPETPVEG